MNPPELKTLILAEWAKGKSALEIATTLGLTEGRVAGIISYSSGPEFQKANPEHYQNRASQAAFKPRKLTRANADREERALRLWADGASAGDIAAEFGVSRNVVIGIVHRAKGAEAEAAKRMHIAQRGSGRVTAARPRREYMPYQASPAKRDARANRANQARAKPPKQHKPVLSPQALAAQKAKAMAAQQAAIARVELTLIANLAFVRVEKAWDDPYAHMRTEKAYFDAMAALTR